MDDLSSLYCIFLLMSIAFGIGAVFGGTVGFNYDTKDLECQLHLKSLGLKNAHVRIERLQDEIAKFIKYHKIGKVK